MKKLIVGLGIVMMLISCVETTLECDCVEEVNGYEMNLDGTRNLIHYELELSEYADCDDDGIIIGMYDNGMISITSRITCK